MRKVMYEFDGKVYEMTEDEYDAMLKRVFMMIATDPEELLLKEETAPIMSNV